MHTPTTLLRLCRPPATAAATELITAPSSGGTGSRGRRTAAPAAVPLPARTRIIRIPQRYCRCGLARALVMRQLLGMALQMTK